MDSLVECKLELEPPLERDMAGSAVACTLARLAACERDLMACKAVSHSGSRAAALRYIGLARQMLEHPEAPAGRPGRAVCTARLAPRAQARGGGLA